MRQFDLIVHLAGEQVLPLYMAIEQYDCDRHVVIATERTSPVFKRLRDYYAPRGKTFTDLRVTPYQLGTDTMSRIIATVQEMCGSGSIGFNLTGGTKPMFAVAFAACQKLKGIPFYVETTGKTIDFLAGNFEREDLLPNLTIEACVELTGHRIRDAGEWADDPRRERYRHVTNFLWSHSRALASIYKKLSEWTDKDKAGEPFDEKNRRGNVVAKLDPPKRGRLEIAGHVKEFKNMPDFASYLCGGWFEQYCYQRLEPLLKSGQIKDMRIGFIPGWDSEQVDKDAQEFDLVCTDGYTLTIAECKAGNVKQHHLQKLENNVKRYGGAFGRGILLSVFPLTRSRTVVNRIKDSDCITAIAAGAVEHELQHRFLSGKPGKIYSQRFGRR